MYNAKAGWTHAYNALDSVYKDCKQLGVNFRFGASGTVKAAVINEDGSARGVELEDGSVLAADRVILACGAWLDSIIDTHGQCLAKWCVDALECTTFVSSRLKRTNGCALQLVLCSHPAVRGRGRRMEEYAGRESEGARIPL